MEFNYKNFTFLYEIVNNSDIRITEAYYNLENNPHIFEIPSKINDYYVRYISCTCKFNLNFIKYIRFPDTLYDKSIIINISSMSPFKNLQVVKLDNILIYRQNKDWKLL